MEDASFFIKIRNSKTLCLNSQCPQAPTCRRYQYAQSIPQDKTSFSVFNPAYLAQFANLSECPHYWSTDLVHYAQGFTKILQQLPVKVVDSFRITLISRYGRKNYYRYRKGDLLLPPSEQEYITNLVHQLTNSNLPVEFDGYDYK